MTRKEFLQEFEKRKNEAMAKLGLKPANIISGTAYGMTATEIEVRGKVYWDLVRESDKELIHKSMKS